MMMKNVCIQDDTTARRERQHEPQGPTYHEAQAEFNNGLRGGQVATNINTEAVEREEYFHF